MKWRHALLVCLGLWSIGAASAADLEMRTGKQLYVQFCASCHGSTGKGDGPVSSSFGVEVPDLTLIARRHGGKYPRDLVLRIIDGRHTLTAHGTRVMPVWGEDLGRVNIGDPNAEAIAGTVLLRLADYVWLLQRPASDADVPQTKERS
jgi:mono/diheme cytochrome c family protein